MVYMYIVYVYDQDHTNVNTGVYVKKDTWTFLRDFLTENLSFVHKYYVLEKIIDKYPHVDMNTYA